MPDHDNNFLNDMSRLKWACRRGMLELDLILGNFLQEVYPSLSVAEKRSFVTLLNQPDPELLAVLMGEERPNDPALNHITDIIKQHARSRM